MSKSCPACWRQALAATFPAYAITAGSVDEDGAATFDVTSPMNRSLSYKVRPGRAGLRSRSRRVLLMFDDVAGGKGWVRSGMEQYFLKALEEFECTHRAASHL